MKAPRTLIVLAGALALTLSPALVLGQEASAPPRSAEMEAQADDLLAMFPSEIGGLPVEGTTQVTVGQEIIDQLDPVEDVEDIADINAILEATGGSIDDVATAVSFIQLDESTFGFIGAFRILGSSANDAIGAYVGSFSADLAEPRVEETQIGGKDVFVLYDDGSEGSEPIVIYPAGDTVWVVAFDEPLLSEVISQLG